MNERYFVITWMERSMNENYFVITWMERSMNENYFVITWMQSRMKKQQRTRRRTTSQVTNNCKPDIYE
jgi:hypothetical protein